MKDDGPGIDKARCMIDAADGDTVYYYHFDGLGSVVAGQVKLAGEAGWVNIKKLTPREKSHPGQGWVNIKENPQINSPRDWRINLGARVRELFG